MDMQVVDDEQAIIIRYDIPNKNPIWTIRMNFGASMFQYHIRNITHLCNVHKYNDIFITTTL